MRLFFVYICIRMDNNAQGLFQLLFRPLQKLPLGFHYFWGKLFSWFAKNVMHYRRDIIVTNLSRSFPEKKYGEIKELTDKFYRHLGEIFAEAVWFGGCFRKPERLHDKELCRITDPEVILSAYENSPSVMVMTSHLGNWEVFGGLFQYFYDVPKERLIPNDAMCFAYKKLSSNFWDRFFAVNRTAVMDDDFKGYVESKSILRWAVEHKNEKKLYIFPTDQFPYKGAGRHEIPSFMGQKTQTMEGSVLLARKFHMSVLYMGMVDTGEGKHEISFREICRDGSQMTADDILEKFYAFLEEDIKRDPANYLWSHKRWK